MAKIIEIDKEIISLGLDDGSIKEVRVQDLNFEPTINDEVDIFETEMKCIVSKKAKVEEKLVQTRSEGINIHVDNSNTNNSNNMGNTPNNNSNNTKAVNKIVYCILAFLLGGIGVHKFYAGKISTGIVYFLFCWTYIPALLALIDGIVGVTKKADASGNILV